MDGYGGGGGGSEKNALASELAQVLSMVRELEARMDQDLPAAARELCGELANTVDRSIRIARSADSPPGHASDGNNAQSKRRKATGTPCVRRQVRVASVKDMAPLDDGLSWRKYGQKDILGAKYPRAYFRCTHRHSQGCLATKHVQRADADPLLYDAVYHGAHACVQAAHPRAEELRRELMHGGQDHQDQEQQQSSSPRALELEPDTAAEGLQLQAGGLLEPMTPYASFAAPTPGDFPGCFPLLSPTGVEWQMMRSSHTSAGNGMDLVDHHQFQFDDLFTNAAEPFHWDLYAAN